MQITGTESLALPQMSEFSFILKDISLSSYNQYSFKLHIPNFGPYPSLYFQSGKIRAIDNTTYFASYNTGEEFSISGWYFQNGATNSLFGYVNDVPFRFDNLVQTPVDVITITVPSAATFNFRNLTIDGPGFNLDIALQQGFSVGSGLSGNVVCDTSGWVYGSSLRFYNSAEDLLTGSSLIAYLGANTPETIYYGDNDSSRQNNSITFDNFVNTFSGQMTERFNINRTGLYETILTTLLSLQDEAYVSGLFNGDWSGTNFVYEDLPQSITLNYFIKSTDSVANSKNEVLSFSLEPVSPTSGAAYQSSYITGFTLTSSGEYTQVPSVLFTGYYYVTGLQQGLETLLFSSGCTGNLNVTFLPSNGLGANASGTLNTHQVLFKDIYGNGVNAFYVADSYTLYSGGTGYVMPPQAIVNTGAYGSQCYDVPKTSGVNIAWFKPFNTSGSTVASASYLTGTALYTTGLVSGGATTGYVVTGIDISNIGSGYSSLYIPKVSFIRLPGDTLSGNASGTFSLKSTGFYNFNLFWDIETGLAGKDLTGSAAMTGAINLSPQENYVSIRLNCSGLDNTQPVLSILKLSGAYGTSLVQYITGAKYFDITPDFLKKKLSVSGEFTIGKNLSFLVTQSELDTFYSTAGFTNNTWTIDVGDLDF